MEACSSVLVCVTQQRNCERLIRTAAQLAAEGGTLQVLHVSSRTFNFFENIREGEALEYLFVIAKSVGADLTIINATQIPETVAQFAEHQQIGCIVIGETGKIGSSVFEARLQELLKDSGIQVVTLPTESL